MKIVASQLGKRYNRDWIFKDLSYEFRAGATYAIVGPNGSGKSTLLQVLWGQLPPSRGEARYETDQQAVPVADVFKHVSIATPYLELVEEFTLDELVAFHFRFKQPRSGFSVTDVIEAMELTHARKKYLSQFSSGMKQRVKLGLAMLSQTPLLFLDEPGTNLDQAAFAWYSNLLNHARKDRLILIASNQPDEYPADAIRLNIMDFKPVTPAV
jgi:ABC-type multidrug transport system ATPase subunit